MADRPLLVLHDEEDGQLVYDLLLLQDETTLACFPRPIARFHLSPWASSFAVSGGSILGVTYSYNNARAHDSVMGVGGYDYFERQAKVTPRKRDAEGRVIMWMPSWRPPFQASRKLGNHEDAPVMLPMGDGTVIRMDTIIFDGFYMFEMLRILPDGGGWHATPLPKPPLGRMDKSQVVFISAYFALGTRVWISITDNGTFSLDIANHDNGTWRKEGIWMLPFEGRALHVAELNSVIGLSVESRLLCACSVSSAPVFHVRHVWRETYPFPWEECVNDGMHNPAASTPPRNMPSLAYLGNGRFCICRPMSNMEPSRRVHIKYNACSFLVVEVRRSYYDGDLQLIKRGKTSYMWLPQGRQSPYMGFLQPAT